MTAMERMQDLMTREEPLCDELKPFVHAGAFGDMIHHPLVIEIFHRPDRCALVNERYRLKKQELAEVKAKSRWGSFIFLHERPYRIRALEQVMAYGAKDVHSLVAQVWIDSENIYQHKASWMHIWSTLENPHLTMDANELAAFTYMPETVTIHRGIRGKSLSPRGLSWTRDKERAVWFAHRHKRKADKPVVLTAEVSKARILAYFHGRDEAEVVVLPRHLRNVRE